MEGKNINTVEYIKMIKESPEKKKSYIFFGFTILVSLLLIVFAIRPTIVIITKINREIKEKSALNDSLQRKIDTLVVLDKEYNERKVDFDTLQMIFPSQSNFSLLMANIESVVAKNGFVLSAINFDDYKIGTYKSSTNVLGPKALKITVKGRESNIVNLLKGLESLPMYPVVESLSYATQRDKEGFLAFSIFLRVYSVDNNNFYK